MTDFRSGARFVNACFSVPTRRAFLVFAAVLLAVALAGSSGLAVASESERAFASAPGPGTLDSVGDDGAADGGEWVPSDSSEAYAGEGEAAGVLPEAEPAEAPPVEEPPAEPLPAEEPSAEEPAGEEPAAVGDAQWKTQLGIWYAQSDPDAVAAAEQAAREAAANPPAKGLPQLADEVPVAVVLAVVCFAAGLTSLFIGHRKKKSAAASRAGAPAKRRSN